MIALTLAATTALIAAGAPAFAASKGAFRDDFWMSCDAQAYVQDNLTGASRIDAFGGYSCLSRDKWTGTITIDLFKNGSVVKTAQVRSTGLGSSTNDVGVTVADPTGNQNWHARLRLSGAGIPSGVTLTTGVLVS